MKRNLLLTVFSIFISVFGFSQSINHIDYGDSGLVIGLDESYPMDIDNDGTVDFYVNSWENELGFTPIFAIGCFVSEEYGVTTSWGSSVLTTFEEGAVLEINPENMYDYLDDDRGSNYKSGEGATDGWANGESNYIGFAVFRNGTAGVTNGWMKVKLDTDNESLIILEYAYHDYVDEIGDANIVVGDRGLVNVQNLDGELTEVNLAPNPVVDIFSINYNYLGTDNIQISVIDNVGKEILKTSGNNQSRLLLDASTWSNGTYFINFNTDKGVHTERIIVSH